ncbi:MAG: hypothetical protein ACOC16_02675 [Nanoarchaeota archaeon]
MTKKLTVLELPIYRDYFPTFLEILNKLEEKLKTDSTHKLLIKKTYETVIEIFPNLNSGFNYWGTKGKLQIYNKVRMLLSKMQSQLHLLFELQVFEKDYFEELESSIRYLGGLIKKIEGLPNEK